MRNERTPMVDPTSADNVQNGVDRRADEKTADNLSQIQEILFGRDRRDIDRRLEDLDEVLRAQIKELRGSTRKQVSVLEEQVNTRATALDQRVDTEVQDRAEEFAKLSTEMGQTFEQLEGRFDDRIDRLAEQLREELTSLREHLDERASELSAQLESTHDRLENAKLDRIAIAGAFRQMADSFDDDSTPESGS